MTLASEAGRSADRYLSLVVDDAVLERGLAETSLTVDMRLREALRVRPGRVVETDPSDSDPGLISESVGVRDADIVRLTRFVDGLTAWVADLEARAR